MQPISKPRSNPSTTPHHWSISLSRLLPLLALVLLASGAWATSNTWVAASGTWNDAANWTPASIPTFTSTTTINSGTANVSTGVSGSFFALSLGSSANSVGTLNLSGGLLTENNSGSAKFVVGESNSGTGIVMISSGTLATPVGGVIGSLAGSYGSVSVSGGL